MTQPNIVALIPARAGSKRVPGKNIRLLGAYPLIAYTIAAAIDSGIFSAIIVSTDSEEYAQIAEYYGAEIPFLRPAALASSTSPDIEWVEYTLAELAAQKRHFDCFSILRPTSPFRQAATIQRAWQQFLNEKGIDSLRAVEKCAQHPGKMWQIQSSRLMPLLQGEIEGQPWHSCQYAALPEIYVQNASLEIAWSRIVFEERTIAGQTILPFFTQDLEGFDINNEDDWILAESYLSREQVHLPPISKLPYFELKKALAKS